MEASFVTSPPAPPPTSFSAFERFFREHYPAVVRIAYGVVQDAQAAQDVAQDVFISAFERFPEPDRGDHAPAWVRVAAAHAGLNALRGERRRDRRQQLSGIMPPPVGPEEAVLDRESRAEIRHALSQLPRRSATVLLLRHSGMSYAEVAGAMDVKVGQVGTMLRRAETALRKELARQHSHRDGERRRGNQHDGTENSEENL
jgi:RNA polymerase sigma factor (sigma-70 family)